MPPLPAIAARALLTSLGNEARGLFATDNSPVFDPSGFLADPNTPPLSQQPAKAIGRQICRAWARREGDSNNPAADRLYGGACAPYLDSIGERPEPGNIAPPFSGGQCPEFYRLYTTTRDPNTGAINGGGEQLIATRQGPIGYGSLDPAPSGCAPGSIGEASRQFISPTGAFAPLTIHGAACGAFKQFISARVERVDGLPDECGSPDPEYNPPRRPINLPPITPIFIDLPDVGEINVDVNFNVDGTFTIESPELNVEVNIGSPDVTIGGGGGGGEGVPGGGLSGPPADTGDGGTASGDAPPGNELVGVRVEILESPNGANEYANNASTIFRGIGYVRMGYPGRLALDLGGAAVISPQFFFAPVRGLTSWEVRANLGFINRITPFYRVLPS